MAEKMRDITKKEPPSNFFLDEAFGITMELLKNLISSLPETSYFWIAFQNKKCPDADELKGILYTFCITFKKDWRE